MASLLGLTLNQRREDKVRERERVKGLQESICGGAMEKKNRVLWEVVALFKCTETLIALG